MSTVTLQTMAAGAVTVPAKWRGVSLAVHVPFDKAAGVSAPKRGQWRITHWPTGLSAGLYRGTLKDAIALAQLWDTAFHAALLDCHHAEDNRPDYRTARRPSLRDWPQAPAWLAQLRREAPATGPVPVNAGPVLPVIPAKRDAMAELETAQTYHDVERAVWRAMGYEPAGDDEAEEQYPAHETVAADLLRNGSDGVEMSWRGRWYLVPTMGDVESWCLGSVAETPDGRTVEPDAPEGWPRLLGLI